MENVLIKNVDLIEEVTLHETKNLISFLDSTKDSKNDCLIIKNGDSTRVYFFNGFDKGLKVSAIKIDGVGVRSNLSVIPLVLDVITKTSEFLDLFTNETSIIFIIDKCNNKNIVNDIKNIFRKEGFDVKQQ
jgi:hypothetical protein